MFQPDPEWIICTDMGGRSYLMDIAKHADTGDSVAIWCANQEKAKRFKSLGDVAQAMSIIPSYFNPYEEDPRWMDCVPL